jgi:hypothetical protein
MSKKTNGPSVWHLDHDENETEAQRRARKRRAYRRLMRLREYFQRHPGA